MRLRSSGSEDRRSAGHSPRRLPMLQRRLPLRNRRLRACPMTRAFGAELRVRIVECRHEVRVVAHQETQNRSIR